MACIVLRIVEGPASGAAFTFDEACRVLVGHGVDCGIRLGSDIGISTHHCLIELNPPSLEIRDLASSSGIVLNGVRIGDGREPSPPIALVPGDRIAIGSTTLLYEREAGPSVAAPHADLGDLEATIAEIAGLTVIRRLDEGGMGAVFQVRRDADGANLVVKMMLPSFDDLAQAMFEREIATTRALAHPNIVPLESEGTTGKYRYFVMRYCDGGSVQDLVTSRGGKLDEPTAVAITLQALAGLAHAHSQGIIHRDVKPANLLISDGVTRLTDFGLAKSFDASRPAFAITSTGMVGGTPLYMPREQLLNLRATRPPSDVWSMGATLYYLLTGSSARADLPGKDAVTTILMNPIIPLRDRAPHLSPALAAVVDKSLAESPDDRFANASEMHAALLSAD